MNHIVKSYDRDLEEVLGEQEPQGLAQGGATDTQ